MNIPNETQATLDRLLEECHGIMASAEAAGRDLTAADLKRVRFNAAEFDQIRAKARYSPTVQDKADLRARLRYVGLSKSAADRVATVGWPALSPQAAAADATAAIRAAARRLRP